MVRKTKEDIIKILHDEKDHCDDAAKEFVLSIIGREKNEAIRPWDTSHLPLQEAIEELRRKRKAGHPINCACKTTRCYSWGCYDLRQRILGSTMWRIVYEG